VKQHLESRDATYRNIPALACCGARLGGVPQNGFLHQLVVLCRGGKVREVRPDKLQFTVKNRRLMIT